MGIVQVGLRQRSEPPTLPRPGHPLRRSIERLSPNVSLALLAVPAALVEPLKLLAVIIFGTGHWITGTLMMAVAYALSLFAVERLFRIVKPKLLELRWFAAGWKRFVAVRAWAASWLLTK
jgi:hypothetical protein